MADTADIKQTHGRHIADTLQTKADTWQTNGRQLADTRQTLGRHGSQMADKWQTWQTHGRHGRHMADT